MTWIIAFIVAGLWSWPATPVRITERFDMPDQTWSAGHRGIDLELRPGSLIRSIGDGRVAYVGIVAGTPVIAIEHPGTGLRSTYQPVVPTVQTGDAVASGELIGYLAAPLARREEGIRYEAGGHCDGRCLHLGLRGGDGYVDPLSVLPRLSAILKPIIRRVGAPIAGGPAQTWSAAALPTRGCTAASCPRMRARAVLGQPEGRPLPQGHGWQRYAEARVEQVAAHRHLG